MRLKSFLYDLFSGLIIPGGILLSVPFGVQMGVCSMFGWGKIVTTVGMGIGLGLGFLAFLYYNHYSEIDRHYETEYRDRKKAEALLMRSENELMHALRIMTEEQKATFRKSSADSSFDQQEAPDIYSLYPDGDILDTSVRQVSGVQSTRTYARLRAQRNLFATLSVLLLVLSIFLSIRPIKAQTPPPDAPQATQQATVKTYVASVNSNKYHRTSCISAQNMLPENQVWYASLQQAENDGKTRCSKCFQ